MSLSRLHARVCRLEQDAARVLWVADFRASCVRLMAEASTEIMRQLRREADLRDFLTTHFHAPFSIG
jgi:hypothetical protein